MRIEYSCSTTVEKLIIMLKYRITDTSPNEPDVAFDILTNYLPQDIPVRIKVISGEPLPTFELEFEEELRLGLEESLQYGEYVIQSIE